MNFRKNMKINLFLLFLLSYSNPRIKDVLDYNVLPKHYSLKIVVKEENFEGEEKVYLEVKKDTVQFNFNASDMDIRDIRLYLEGKRLEPRIEIKKGVGTLLFDEELKAGSSCTLTLKFKGKYSEDLSGFYKSFYNKDLLFSTKFQPAFARRAFPCWDQPDMKATFDIAIKPLEGFVALSNSSLKKIKEGFYYFNTTPRMSTYLVAFISGKFESIVSKTKRKVPIRVYAHKDDKELGKYALNVAVECLDFFEEYFGINYPLPKLDLVTVPAFSGQAMENWGLITFRKSFLLFEEDSDSISHKKGVSSTVCHELAHMWFGNLVTMTWWNDLWLNEGFATWASSLALSHLSKDLVDWEVWNEFINDEMESSMFHDSLTTSHPISVNVKEPSEIIQLFDSISYSKGACMIRMLESYIGKKEFKRGIRTYLLKFQYKNATTHDLWDSFNKDLKVEELMDFWIYNKGFPLVSVKDEGDQLVLTQKEFSNNEGTSDKIWQIPLLISWIGKREEMILMNQRTIKIKKHSPIYKINSGVTGYYRTSYEIDSLMGLLKSKLSVDDRLNLVNDICALCISRKTKIDTFLKIIHLFKDETNKEILSSILGFLDYIRAIWNDNEKFISKINKISIELIKDKVYQIDIYDKEVKSKEITTKSLLIGCALKIGDRKIIEELSNAFEKRKEVNPEFLGLVCISVVDQKLNEIFELSRTSSVIDEKISALSSLALISDPGNLMLILNRYKEMDSYNSVFFFIELGNNLRNREMILNFMIGNFDEIRKFVKNDMIFSNILEEVLSTSSSEPMASKIIAFLRSRKSKDFKKSIDNIIEKIENNLKFKEFNFKFENIF